jgi:hypothetical protein
LLRRATESARRGVFVGNEMDAGKHRLKPARAARGLRQGPPNRTITLGLLQGRF